jgi:hypothetical protein
MHQPHYGYNSQFTYRVWGYVEMSMKITAFWDTAPRSLTGEDQRFHHPDDGVSICMSVTLETSNFGLLWDYVALYTTRL